MLINRWLCPGFKRSKIVRKEKKKSFSVFSHLVFHPRLMLLDLYQTVYTLPNDTFFDWSKLKAFADNKINVAKKQKFFLGWVENIVGKEEIAGYRHFHLFSTMFSKASFSRGVKS